MNNDLGVTINLSKHVALFEKLVGDKDTGSDGSIGTRSIGVRIGFCNMTISCRFPQNCHGKNNTMESEMMSLSDQYQSFEFNNNSYLFPCFLAMDSEGDNNESIGDVSREKWIMETAAGKFPSNKYAFGFISLIDGREEALKYLKNRISICNEDTPKQMKIKVLGNSFDYLHLFTNILCNGFQCQRFEGIENIVVTVPCHFNDTQRLMVRDTVSSASGKAVNRIMNQATAACMAYGIDQYSDTSIRNVVVFHLGFFHLEIVLIEYDVQMSCTLCNSSDVNCAGDAIDEKICQFIIRKLRELHSVDINQASPEKFAQMFATIRKASEIAKRDLSKQENSTIVMNDIAGLNGSFSMILTREQLQVECAELFKIYRNHIQKVLQYSKQKKIQITDIVFTGGTCNLPNIQQFIIEEIKSDSTLNYQLSIHNSLNSQLVSSMGAAKMAKRFETKKDILPLDIVPLSIGVEVNGSIMFPILQKDTIIPCKHTVEGFFPMHKQAEGVLIRIFEGNRAFTFNNTLLKEIHVGHPANKENPISVCLEIDANGVLKYSISNSLNTFLIKDVICLDVKLSERDIKRKVEEAKQHSYEHAIILDKYVRQSVPLFQCGFASQLLNGDINIEFSC